MEQYVTRIGDVTIQRVIPSGGGPPEPVRVMDGEELLRAVKEEPIDEDEEENEEESPTVGDEETPMEGDQEDDKVNEKEDPEEEEGVEEEEEDEEEKIIIKAEPQDQDELLGEDNESDQRPSEDANEDEQLDEAKEGEEEDDKSEKEKSDEYSEDKDKETGECSKRKADNDTEDDEESSSKKKKVEIDVDIDKKKISNLRRNIREVMDETQLDEATLSAQRQEAERLRRVQDQQKYIREVQRQIQLNRQNSKTQSRVISLLQGGSTSILKSSSVGSTTTATSTGPSTVLVKVGSGQQQVLNRKTLEVLRGGKSVSSSTEQVKSGISRVTTSAKPGMVTPSVSIAPVKPVFQGEAQKKVPPNDADIVTISSSDSDDDCIVISEGEEEEEEEEEEMDDDPTNSGMHTNDLYNIPDDQGRVLINVGRPDDEPDIFLAPQIARVIKPHQIGGVRFLFDNVVESLERFNNSTGFGCILAHSMGLGKTLQVVSFCDVFLRETSARTVMCIMPINTLQNWMAEFNMWLPTDPSNCPLAVHGEVRPRHFNIYVLNDLNKTIASRAKVVEEWYREGGVLLIGYEMYRQLSLKRAARVRKGKKKQVEEDVEDEKNKPLLEAMHEALVKPGPDLVICDEGHRIKNSHASISHALKQIRTKRRVVLTGYPLQNNLLEYWCMVDFVRPNYLGTKTEFSNMFERPIQNGQCIDSTPQDIRLMRYRAHVLHSLLEGFVQRRSHSVLRHSLPQKEEYVLLVRMTPLQRKLYDTFMNEVVRTKAVPNPLKAFAVCCKIWNHPDILYNFLKKKEMDELQDLDLEETAALQQQQTGPNSPRRPLAKEKRTKKEVKKAQVAPIKAEVTSQPQTQPQTPEVKQEERKFDFPNSGQSSGGGAPGYDYYPPPPYPDPYHYQRPPYYPGYYQEGPPAAAAAAGHPFYHHPPPPQGYDQPPAYSGGYYPNYEAPYPPKADDFGKGSWNSPPFSNPSVKQEKNQSKSPKEHEAPAKPGFQEFYSVKKEEKPDPKEEKQTFLCGFSGGQVSYNYRNYPGTGAYPNYPYPPSEYPGWNKGFPPFPPGDAVMQGTQGGNSGGTASGNQPGLFGGQNTSEVQQRANPNQERHHNMQPSSQHSGSDRNSQSDSQSGSSSKDNQHKSHSGHERGQNPQDSMHGNYMNMHIKGNEHMKKQVPELLSSNNQNMYGNKKHDAGADPMQRNQDNTSKNRNTQESEAKNLQNVNHPPGQHNLFNPHETMRNQSQHYGNRNQQDDFRMAFSSPERPTTGSQNPHESSTLSPQVSKNSGHQQFSNSQAPPDNQQRSHHSSSEQNMTPNPYNNQRTDRGLRGAPEHLSNVASISLQSESDRMAGIHPGVYGNPENPLDHSNRPYGNQEHFSSNQKNIYGNKRNEHNLPSNQEHGSHQMGGQQMQDPPRRPSIGHDNIHPSPNMFNNQRSDNVVHGYQDHGQLSQQNSPVSHEKQEIRNRHHSSQEHHSGSQQMYANQRNDNENQLATPTSKHSGQHNMAMLPGQEHIQPNQQNLGMMSGPPHNAYGNQEVMQSNQHGMYRAPNQHDGQHRGSSGYYSNQFGHGMNSGQEAQNQQANINQNQKAMPSGADHSSGIQQNMYSNQSDHSVQKMIRNEPHLESHQMMHSGQERPPNQYNIYPPPDTMYHNQHVSQGSHETSMQNPSEKQSAQDSQHNNPHMNRDRLNSQGAHSNQDRHSGAQAMFNNPNSDMHWHGLTERSGQQNIYDQSQQSKDDNTHKDKHQFHGNQDYSSHSQQNVYSGQSNQSLHRNAEIHGKHQGMMGHENQYRIVKDRSDRNPAMMSGIENKSNSQDSSSIPGSSHNRHNTSDHGILNPHENIQNSQNLHGSQHMQRNISHPSQEQMHNMMGNKSGTYGNSDHSHVGVNSQGVTTSLDGSQNVTGVQNYGLQNSPQQPHLGNQHNIHGNQSMNSQNANRNQHSSMNSIEQQSGSSHSHTDSQNMYSNQYHSQGDQHTMNNQNLHGNQHMKTHHSSQQSGQNIQQMYGNQMSQGSSSQSNNGGQGMSLPHQNQGMHPQNQNHSQNPHVPPMNQGHVSTQSNQGIPSSGQINQGQHGGQYPLHMNQPFPNSSQYQTSQTMHGNKDQSNAIPHNKGSPYQSSHHNSQYIQNLNQQSSTHNVHSDHMSGSQNTNKMAHNQHNLPNQAPLHNKSPTTPTKSDFQKLQSSPMSHLPPHHQQNVSQNQPVSQQGTQTAGDNAGQNSGSQHRIQNMLNYQTGGGPPYEQNIITSSKGMSGGQVLQGVQQQKHSMQNVLGNNDDQNRFRDNFNESYPPNNDFQGNYQKPGFYGQDFNYGYQGQFPYQDKQFPEQPGPSGQTFRKEDDKTSDENKTKDTEKKSQHENGDNIKMNSTSTSTETEDDKEKKDKKDEEEKVGEKKPDGKPDSTTPQKSGKEDPGIPYDWATEILKGYVPGDISASAKMAVFFCILEESIALGDRILVFSQSLFTLNLMEELLQQQLVSGKEDERWAKNVNYYRLDGSTTAMEREKLINEFNSNANLHLFLVSTRAGSLGINLVGANRVIVFDASWNPCHDTQAVCRVYRYGQKKPCFVYRLVTDNCLEKKIYDRQINKQGMSDRVVDECNPDAHLSIKEVTSLCWDDKEDDDTPKDFTSLQDQYIDVVLQKVIQKHSIKLSKEPFAHESLLVDRKEKKLSSAEKRLAKRSYELEKQASARPMYNGINQNQVRPKPMASVRPMQAEMGQAGRQRGWIPASVWQRQGMSAQEMTLPLDVVIPTNSADRASIVLKAGQKVMVLKSPKGIYMQLENGKIIAIRTAFKVGGKKPGEQQGKVGPAELVQRRGLRQIGATRGRPIRAVGPVTRPPPVSVTVTKKRLSEDEQAGRKEDESESSESSQPTPMEVSEVSSTEKECKGDGDAPNPFTAAAAASLSTMQVSHSEDGQKHMDSMEQSSQLNEKQSTSPNSVHLQQLTPQLQNPPTPVPIQPQVPMSPQPPQASVQPLPAKPIANHPQVSVQPIVQNPVQTQVSPAQAPVKIQPANQKPTQLPVQPQTPTSVLPQHQQSVSIPMETQPLVPTRSPMHMQQPVQPQSAYPNPTQVSILPSVAPHPQPLSHPPMQAHPPTSAPLQTPVPLQTHTQAASPLIAHPQVSASIQTHGLASAQHPLVSSASIPQQGLPSTSNPSQSQSHSSSIQTQTQTSPNVQSLVQTSSSIQTHPQVPSPMHPQPPLSLHPHYPIPSHPQAPFPIQQQAPHHPHSSPYSMQSQQQKQSHFPSLPPHQFPLPPQQGQYPMPPQQSQFLGHPTHQTFPMHPQPQYPIHPQQPYPVQPQPQYPLQPHLQQPQYPGQPPHQFPLHPQSQYPLQPSSQFDPSSPVPSSMMTDHLS